MATSLKAPDVIGLAEVAELADVAPSTVRSWIVRGTTPPLPPHTQLASGPVWRQTHMLDWLAHTGRLALVNAAALRMGD